MWADEHTDNTKLTVAFRNFAKGPNELPFFFEDELTNDISMFAYLLSHIHLHIFAVNSHVKGNCKYFSCILHEDSIYSLRIC
jgi:hypothetical protein